MKERLGECDANGDPIDNDTSYSREGTKAHELAEIKLRKAAGEFNDFLFSQRRADWAKRFGDSDQEMEDATDYYADTVMERLMEARRDCPDAQLLLETRLDYSDWAQEGFGTSDAIIVGDKILDVIDLKYGKGVEISAIENPQARLYGLGAYKKFGAMYDFPTVRNTIIQPRRDNVSTEELSREALLQWGDDVVKPAAALAWEGKGDFCPGDHCRFCLCKAVCSARASKALKIFELGLEAPPLLDDAQIPQILQYAEIAEAWIKELKQYAQDQAIKGQHWVGFKLVHGRGSRTWISEDEAQTILLQAGFTSDTIMETKMKSVSALEKALGKKTFRSLLNEQVLHQTGALTLVPESDRRPEASPGDSEFADIAAALDDEPTTPTI